MRHWPIVGLIMGQNYRDHLKTIVSMVSSSSNMRHWPIVGLIMGQNYRDHLKTIVSIVSSPSNMWHWPNVGLITITCEYHIIIKYMHCFKNNDNT